MTKNGIFQPIGQPRLLHEIYGQIKRNVQEGTLKKGDKLPAEREMAQAMGVSRATLREAIKSLELVGLIKCIQGDGNYIAENLTDSMSEPLSIMFLLEEGTAAQIHQFRCAIEIAAVQGAACGIEEARLAQMDGICTCLEQEDALDEREKADQDRQFHNHIAKGSGNPLIVAMMNAAETLIQNEIRDSRKRMVQDSGALVEINKQHREILSGLRAKNEEAAVNAMVKHMDFVRSFYQEYMK